MQVTSLSGYKGLHKSMFDYTSAALKGIRSLLPQNVRLPSVVWNSLIANGISQTKPTRRGCRAGGRKIRLSATPFNHLNSTYILSSPELQRNQEKFVIRTISQDSFVVHEIRKDKKNALMEYQCSGDRG